MDQPIKPIGGVRASNFMRLGMSAVFIPTILSFLNDQPIEAAQTLACTVVLDNHDSILQITALLEGQPGQIGWYTMETLSQTGFSRSHSRQSGRFEIGASGAVVLGRSLIGRSNGSTVNVHVKGKTDQTHEIFDCRADT